MLIFLNAANDMLTLEMYPVKDENVLRVTLKHQSAAEVAAIQKQLDEEAAADVARLERCVLDLRVRLDPVKPQPFLAPEPLRVRDRGRIARLVGGGIDMRFRHEFGGCWINGFQG